MRPLSSTREEQDHITVHYGYEATAMQRELEPTCESTFRNIWVLIDKACREKSEPRVQG
jgi:hypothetical protein